MNSARPQSSTLVDLKDPIQVHLLTETALTDSKEYAILSQEEVDGLKKQIQALSKRIEQARINLTLQAKYRDAAISMSKLYSPGGGKRRSLLGSTRSSNDETAIAAEIERQNSQRRCEEIATELFSLEKRLMEDQRKLLQHTAGILQMTHRASAKKEQAQDANADQRQNGIPGSPESLYTYSDGRNSLERGADDLYFDERSLYNQSAELEGRSGINSFKIPMKSPVREKNNQLREETDKLREENRRLNTHMEDLRHEGLGRISLISDTERKLEDLSYNLRELLLRLDRAKYNSFQTPPALYGNGRNSGLEPGDMIGSQVDYLQRAIATAMEEQAVKSSEASKEVEQVAADMGAKLVQAEGRLEALNRQLGDVLQAKEPDYPSPPDASQTGLDGQLNYLQDAFRTMQTELSRASELSSSSSANKQKSEQVEAVLMGLWDIIQTGYADIQQRKADRRKTRIEKGLDPDDEDMSADEAVDADESYSLQAFSTKVQWLYAQATSLKEQKSVLKRQIKQQRELNNKSSSDKDRELTQTTEELRQTRSVLDGAEREAKDAQEKLTKALKDLDNLQQSSASNEAASNNSARQQLMERDARIADLESNGEELRKELSSLESQITFVGGQLEDSLAAKNLAETRADKLQQEVKGKEEELERMNDMIIELKTEATIAKAELEGAYGSRAQRAAEAAKLTKNSENTELVAQNDKLKKELEGALRELEALTTESVATEKGKLELEDQLDDLIADKKRLEAEVKDLKDKVGAEVARLQEQLDAEKLRIPPSPSGGGSGQPRAGAAMLSEQFRATMKEERRKFQDEIKVRSSAPVR